MQQQISFSEALTELKLGKRLSRTNWNGKGQFIQLQSPDDNSKMSRAYLYITTVDAHKVPWVASQTDLLAEDWFIVEGDQ